MLEDFLSGVGSQVAISPVLNHLFAPTLPGPFSGENHHPAGEPRVATDHTGVRLLRRMSPEVWQRQCVEVLHRSVRLPASHCPGRRTGETRADYYKDLYFTHVAIKAIGCYVD